MPSPVIELARRRWYDRNDRNAGASKFVVFYNVFHSVRTCSVITTGQRFKPDDHTYAVIFNKNSKRKKKSYYLLRDIPVVVDRRRLRTRRSFVISYTFTYATLNRIIGCTRRLASRTPAGKSYQCGWSSTVVHLQSEPFVVCWWNIIRRDGRNLGRHG